MTFVKTDSGKTISLRQARLLWETGEFSDWVDGDYPVTVGYATTESEDDIEDALSDDSEDEEDGA